MTCAVGLSCWDCMSKHQRVPGECIGRAEIADVARPTIPRDDDVDLHGQQLPGVGNHVRIREGALNSLHGRIICEGISTIPEQASSRSAFRIEAMGAHVPGATPDDCDRHPRRCCLINHSPHKRAPDR